MGKKGAKRVDFIDIAKGITILLMVVGHCHLQPDFKYFYLWIFSFHMPLFFFISGFFFKPKSNKKLIKTDLDRLVKPYILTSILISLFLLCFDSPTAASHSLIGTLVGCEGNEATKFQLAGGLRSGPIWFLLALFWCRLFYNVLYGICGKYEFLLSFVASLIAWQIGYKIINLPLCILVGLTALMFYSAGYNFRKICLENIKPWHYIIGISIWALSVFTETYLNMSMYIFMRFPLSITTAVIGTIIILKCSTYIHGLFAKILSFLGRHSLDILVAHTCAMHRGIILRWFDIHWSNMTMDLSNLVFTAVIAAFIISYKDYRLRTQKLATCDK